MTDIRLQWHTAIDAAVRIELEMNSSEVQIESEHMLGKKPMQIDLLIIKKDRNVVVDKNIGRIFRMYNIIEYKSPEDYISINDFYKVYGYACFYQSDTNRVGEIDPGELTITFITNAFPRKMVEHIKGLRGMDIIKYDQGIYYLIGDPIPMQIIVTKELSKEKNYWLQSLRNDLKSGGEIQSLIEEYEKKKQEPLYQALVDVILRANWKEVEEEKAMCQALRELFAEELKECRELGLEQGLEQGLERGLAESVLELLGELGEVSERLQNVILSQRNRDVLKKWLKLAAKSATIEAFECKMF